MLIDALSKSQRTRCVPMLKSSANLRGAQPAPAPSPSDLRIGKAEVATSSSPSRSMRSSLTSSDGPQFKNRSLPGQVLAGTKSRTCAANHFQAIKPFKSPIRARKSSPVTQKDQIESVGPRLPGRVLEDTLSRTCAAYFHQEARARSPAPKSRSVTGHHKEPKESKDSEEKAKPLGSGPESPRLGSNRYSPRQRGFKSSMDRACSPRERLPRPTLPPPSARRKTIAEARPVTAPSRPSHAPRPSPRETLKHEGFDERYKRRSELTCVRGYPSELQGAESRIRTGTPSVPISLGTSLPSWARMDAGLSPSQKFMAHSAAERLQRAFRKWWFRNFSSSGPMGFRALRDAVIYLQRWWRLARARRLRRLHLRRLWKKAAIRRLLLEDAVSIVQRGWRTVQIRRLHRAAMHSAIVIQRAWRQRLHHIHIAWKSFAIARLNCWHARRLARDRLIRGIRQFYQVQYDAAVSVQSLWRGRQTRHAFAESRERLERARDRREIMRRKAQLLDMKPTTCPKAAKPERLSDRLRQDLCLDQRAADVRGPTLEDSQKSVQIATPRDRGMQPRSKRPSYGQSRVDTATPRGTHQARLSATVATTTASTQNAVLSTVRTVSSVQSVESLIRDLTNRGCLSSLPCASPFSPELLGHSDLDAVRNWLSGALPSWRILQVLRVECSSAAAAAYNGVSRTLGPERLLWHGTSWDCVANIAQNGFNRAYGGRHGSKLGRGSYFAEDATFALRFCGRSQPRAIFLAGVLPGRFCRGAEGLVEPPALDAGTRYDSTVDDAANPKVFCVFRDFQAIPLYLAEVVLN